MKLVQRTLFTIIVILAALIAVSYLVSSTILLSSFEQLEEQNIYQNVERIRNSLSDSLDEMDRILSNWSTWDETYTFISDYNARYIQANFRGSTLINFRLNLVLVAHISGRIVYGKAMDIEKGEEVPLPESIGEYIYSNSPLVQHLSVNHSVKGILLLPKAPMLIVSRPVLTDEGQGPIRGAMIVGRYLDNAEITRLSGLTQAALELYRSDTGQLPPDLQAARSKLEGDEPIVVWSLDGESMTGYTHWEDIFEEPALFLRVHFSRAIYMQTQTSMRYLLLALMAVGLVFSEAVLFLLMKWVLSRLARLSAGVSEIGTSGDLSRRVSMSGKDELAQLAGDINNMLVALENSQQELRKSQELLEKRVEERTAELAKAAERMAVVNHIARAAGTTLDIDSLMETVYQEIHPLFQSDAFLIALYDQDARELDFRLQVDEGTHEPPIRLPLGENLSSIVITENRPLVVRDWELEKDLLPAAQIWGTNKVARSWLGVPMRIGGRLVGIISVQAYHPDVYGEEEEELLSTIADQVAVAVEAARLYTATRERAEELARLNEIGLALTSTLDFPQVVRAALSQIQGLFQAAYVSLLQSDSWTGQLRFVQTLIGAELSETPIRPEPGEGLAAWSLQQRQPVLVENAQLDPRFSAQVDQHGDIPAQAVMVAPLLTPGYAIGVIEVVSGESATYTKDNLHMLQAIASTLTVALVNARLYSEVKTLLREREQAQTQLIHAEKMTALGKLIASIAHEINNPLQAVQFCLTMVEEEIESLLDTEDARSYLDIIRGEVQRISAIMYRMRSFYRPASEEIQPTDLVATLESVLELTDRQLQHNNVTIERHLAPDLPLVQAKQDHIKQVFLNLVLNAIDAMPAGGTLYVSASLDHLYVRDGDSEVPAVRIEFGDTGVGMSSEVLARLFEPFFTTKTLGSGLGLSISYGIIQSHGGQVTVASKEGDGSTFTILLPVELN